MKVPDPDEEDMDRLDPNLVGKHFDSYWQICKELGCTKEPPGPAQDELEFDDDEDSEE